MKIGDTLFFKIAPLFYQPLPLYGKIWPPPPPPPPPTIIAQSWPWGRPEPQTEANYALLLKKIWFTNIRLKYSSTIHPGIPLKVKLCEDTFSKT